MDWRACTQSHAGRPVTSQMGRNSQFYSKVFPPNVPKSRAPERCQAAAIVREPPRYCTVTFWNSQEQLRQHGRSRDTAPPSLFSRDSYETPVLVFFNRWICFWICGSLSQGKWVVNRRKTCVCIGQHKPAHEIHGWSSCIPGSLKSDSRQIRSV